MCIRIYKCICTNVHMQSYSKTLHKKCTTHFLRINIWYILDLYTYTCIAYTYVYIIHDIYVTQWDYITYLMYNIHNWKDVFTYKKYLELYIYTYIFIDTCLCTPVHMCTYTHNYIPAYAGAVYTCIHMRLFLNTIEDSKTTRDSNNLG